ncbi:dUTP diphosphatase [Candidatus Thioglobus sp.]|uniref:dUTP diphosphatase n=1 Tax=Candidatus Thioglobus sp. TaxID=2026721 RepID=UPI003D0966F7
MNQIKQMFELQQKLNDATNGEIWTEGATKEGRQISWLRCIYMEAAEAIDSFNWKHWKNLDAEHDLDNAKVELVDIWHFLMSEAIHYGDAGFAQIYNDMAPERETDPEKLIEILEKMIAVSASANVDKSQNSLYQLFALFFQAIAHMQMGIPELYKRYLVKNQLNTFRQEHGYKDGSYVKIWGAVEDNVVAFKIMDDSPELTPEQLYEKLEVAYKAI